jgi:hypothetical protein
MRNIRKMQRITGNTDPIQFAWTGIGDFFRVELVVLSRLKGTSKVPEIWT